MMCHAVSLDGASACKRTQVLVRLPSVAFTIMLPVHRGLQAWHLQASKLPELLTVGMGPAQIHWFSIFNSFMMVMFLTGLVAMILLRTLRRDYAKCVASPGIRGCVRDAVPTAAVPLLSARRLEACFSATL